MSVILKDFIFDDTNWINMYDNKTINNLLSNNIYCTDSKSVVSFTNDKLNIFYFAVTGRRLELFQKLNSNICHSKQYLTMLSHYGDKIVHIL